MDCLKTELKKKGVVAFSLKISMKSVLELIKKDTYINFFRVYSQNIDGNKSKKRKF
jgi:hypothetical protein